MKWDIFYPYKSIEMIWEIILLIKETLKESKLPCKFISVKLSGTSPEVSINAIHDEESMIIDFEGSAFKADAHVVVKGPFSIEMRTNKVFSAENANLLTAYLPYALMPYFSRKHKKCYAIAHFAQTLDGRIASSTGDSKWIGNDDNLIHAHKMRALSDAILVGAGTLRIDNPRLNVRLVKGKNPTKVVIGGDKLDFDNFLAVDQNTIIFCQNHCDHSDDQRLISLAKDQDQYKPKELLNVLYHKGIHLVYIEGGSHTTSEFIKQRAIDQVQVHITPKIMGSGLTGFQFEGLNNVEDAIEFSSHRFIPVGDHIMFIGELNENLNENISGTLA